MSVISPQAMLLWATLSSTLLLFLVQHLYRYDRFQCLKWRSSSDGGFKRFMTYSYIISVPLLVTYSVAMAVMKYQAGYISFPNPASTQARPLPRLVAPTPTTMWPDSHQKLIFPLYILFAVAWALEIVSHLEELCFWLFMIKEQGGESDGGVRPWFKSFEYKLWCCGSVVALVLLPLVTLETRHDVQQVEAWTFFAGSICSLIITVWFFKVLWKFPSFLARIQAEDAEPEVIVRLVQFQDLNRLRIVFRLMFVLPLLVLACDGIKPSGPHRILETAGAVDILAMVGGIGCVVSSVITLLIFFPRSIAREQGYATRARSHSHLASKSAPKPATTVRTRSVGSVITRQLRSGGSIHGRVGMRSGGSITEVQRPPAAQVQVTVHTTTRGDSDGLAEPKPSPVHLSPREDDCFASSGPSVIRTGSVGSAVPLVRRGGLHPLLLNYTSPINLFAEDDAQIGHAL